MKEALDKLNIQSSCVGGVAAVLNSRYMMPFTEPDSAVNQCLREWYLKSTMRLKASMIITNTRVLLRCLGGVVSVQCGVRVFRNAVLGIWNHARTKSSSWKGVFFYFFYSTSGGRCLRLKLSMVPAKKWKKSMWHWRWFNSHENERAQLNWCFGRCDS